jgi:hypothetical protein
MDAGAFRSTATETTNAPFVDATEIVPREGAVWSVCSTGPNVRNESEWAAVS